MKVLVVSPHPDDEAIGCGGTVADHVAQGDAVRAVFLTSGEAGGHGADPAEVGRVREAEAHESALLLGITGIDFWRLQDGRFRVTGALVARLRSVLDEWRPDAILVPHPGEQHRDHRAAARLVAGATSQQLRKMPEVWYFEVWTPLADMDRVVDISDVIETKVAAIRAYRSQCDVLRFDEALRGLARYRGEMHSWPGGPYAEVLRRAR